MNHPSNHQAQSRLAWVPQQIHVKKAYFYMCMGDKTTTHWNKRRWCTGLFLSVEIKLYPMLCLSVEGLIHFSTAWRAVPVWQDACKQLVLMEQFWFSLRISSCLRWTVKTILRYQTYLFSLFSEGKTCFATPCLCMNKPAKKEEKTAT